VARRAVLPRSLPPSLAWIGSLSTRLGLVQPADPSGYIRCK